MSASGSVLGRAPRVSVIMNCLNGERFLREALDSVLRQSFTDFEVVFWDNGSADESVAIASTYATGDRRVRVVQNISETVPLGHARAQAVEQAQGEYLAFLDVDDYWPVDSVERRVAFLAAEPTYAACYGGVVEVDIDGQELVTVLPSGEGGWILPRLLLQFDVNVPSLMIRRAMLIDAGLNFDARVHASEEYCLMIQLAAVHAIGVLKAPLAFYRVHSGSLTNNAIERWSEERVYSLSRLEALAPWVSVRYPNEWGEAHARAAFYRARSLLSNGRRADARRMMRGVVRQDVRYLLLWLSLFIPLDLWGWLILWRTGRADPRP